MMIEGSRGEDRKRHPAFLSLSRSLDPSVIMWVSESDALRAKARFLRRLRLRSAQVRPERQGGAG